MIIKAKKYKRKRPGASRNSKDFDGYVPGYDGKSKTFKPKFKPFIVDERALKMTEREADRHSKGSGRKAHRAGTEKLRELDFDPIEKLTEQLEQIDRLLSAELLLQEPRVMVVNNLINAKTRILETLVPYRYGKAPISTIESDDIREPVRIVLTFDPNDDKKP